MTKGAMILTAALAAMTLVSACGGTGARGEIPFPAGYAVMPGDRELWASMSDAERRRALAFLSTGATLQSSTQPD